MRQDDVKNLWIKAKNDDFIAFEEETHKSTIKHLDNLTSKMSRVIEDINNKRE